MSDDLSQELRAFEGSEALANGVFAVCIRGADRIEAQAARIKELEKAVIQSRSLTKLMKPQADRIAELETALKEIKFMTTEAGGAERAEALIDEVLNRRER